MTFVDCWFNSCKLTVFSMKLTKQLRRLKNDDSLNLKYKVANEKMRTLKIYLVLKFYIYVTKRKVKTKIRAKLQ